MNSAIASLSILLVEPSPTQSKIILSHLKEEGVTQIDAVEDGQSALAFMVKYPPDLLISAMYLPDMSAAELFQQVRQNNKLDVVNYMLISSESAIPALEPVRQSGVIAILPKPFAHDDLNRALKTTTDYLDPEEVQLDNHDIAELYILLVDDSFTSRNHIARVLTNMGAQHITIAKNGTEAIEKLSESTFDLIVTDLNMPEVDGQQLTEYVRGELGNNHIPILMVTSEADQSRLEAVQQSGISAICDKPFEPQSVREMLYRVLDDI